MFLTLPTRDTSLETVLRPLFGCLRMGFDKPQQFIYSTRDLCEQIRRVRVAEVRGSVNGRTRGRAELRECARQRGDVSFAGSQVQRI